MISPRMAALGREEIRKLLAASPPLLEGVGGEQLQPHGVDLTLREVALFSTQGQIGITDAERRLSLPSPLLFDAFGDMELPAGAYLITFNEVVHLPRDIMALGFPRSSLLRCGVAIYTAVWDAGYSGRSQALMAVFNPHGFRVRRGARVLQMVFFRLEGEVEEGYRGVFQGENL